LCAWLVSGSGARVREPSALPGWSRAHVLAHVAGQAEAASLVLERTAQGLDPGSMYPSRERRQADIDAGAQGTPHELLRRLVETANRLGAAWAALPADRLDARFSSPAGWTRPVGDIPWLRWREVALHTVDLGASARFAPGDPLVERLLTEAADSFETRPDAPAVTVEAVDSGRAHRIGSDGEQGHSVRGETAELALWLTGRSDGASLSSDGPLPALPAWL
jgi:maleylpyruvate isomerase